MIDIAEYKCCKCDYEYNGKPGPTQCPRCSHLYVKWINFEELRKKWNKESGRND